MLYILKVNKIYISEYLTNKSTAKVNLDHIYEIKNNT